MNYAKFFELAKQRGIAESQIQVTKSRAVSIDLFHHDIENYTITDGQSVVACGIYNGKFGSARTERLDASTFDHLINQIIKAASHSEKPDAQPLFQGSEKYHKKNVYCPELAAIPLEKKLADLREFENEVYAQDSRVVEVEAGYSEREASFEFYNSHGLKLKQKRNFFLFGVYAVANDGKEAKTNYEVAFGADYSAVDFKALAKKAVDGAVAKFGGESIKSKKYPTVLRYDIAAAFVDAFLSSAVADEVQRHSSLLEGKLGQKVASSKLTIEERPLTKNIFFSYFDDEGVASYNKTVVKNGVLQTYFYNRETAAKDGVESTGNGMWEGSRIGTGYSNIYVKPGKADFATLIAPIKDGVYITDIAGLGTGMNARSGDFSCQAEGFHIVDGKLAEPLTLITLSGNLLKMFGDLKGFADNLTLTSGGTQIADCYIKSMNIGGK
ncbi:MAG: TldD/PmbA family protein [Bacilli bacterium]|nr:TldD/PmbA family protein [Bacilli bacterium]